jgi:hypothetical protein
VADIQIDEVRQFDEMLTALEAVRSLGTNRLAVFRGIDSFEAILLDVQP